MRPFVVWNNRHSGHHPIYMRAVVRTAMSLGRTIWVPSESESYLSDLQTTRVKYLPACPSSRLESMRTFAPALEPGLIVILDTTDHIPAFAARRWLYPLRLIDIRAQQTDLLSSTFQRRIWGGYQLALREVIVRRQCATFHTLDHRALGLGSEKLRNEVKALPELKQPRPKESCRAGPEQGPTTHKTAVLIGSLDDRKGIPILVEAAETLKAAGHTEFRFVVAGRPTDAYRGTLRSLQAKAQSQGLSIEFRIGHLSDAQYFELLFYADYVLLPYVNHRGGSGLLASLEGYQGTPIVSDSGWIGEIARRLGLPTFPEGNGRAMANVMLRTQFGFTRSRLRLPSSMYATEDQFGRSIIFGTCL